MLELTLRPEGVVISVRAHPGAKRQRIAGEHAGSLRISVNAAPERGRANEAVVEVLAEALGCRPAAITLISGETSRSKRFLISDLPVESIRQRLLSRLDLL